MSAAPPAFGVKGPYRFLERSLRDNCDWRIKKLFPMPGPIPLRVFHRVEV
jgi:hypothetical protein